MKPVWMVRAGRGGQNAQDFIELGLVALGGEALGPVPPSLSRGDLLRLFEERQPERKPGSRLTWASQLYRFLSEIQQGDVVITYDRERRAYVWGEIAGAPEWLPGKIVGAPNVRRVKWTHLVARDGLTAPTRNTLGAIQTIFLLNEDAATELESRRQSFAPGGQAPMPVPLPTEPADMPAEAPDDAELREEILEKADDFIEDRIARLGWEEMQSLVAGILRAMGYRTTVAEPGPDRGVDIFASPDGLGLQEPRIFVEVKHRSAPTGSQQIRAFLGGRKPSDRCLYVSTGGFTRDALYEAERSPVPIHLIAMPSLRKLLLEHYEALDAETRALVPLRRFYWPVD